MIDTLEIANALKAAEFTPPQAEAVATTLRRVESPSVDLSGLAKKADLDKLATKADLSDAKFELMKWIIGAIGFQTVVILGAVFALA